MRKYSFLSLLFIASAAFAAPPSGVVEAVPFDQVKLHDAFWTPRQEALSKVTLPHAWVQLEPAVENLRRAGNFLAGVPDKPPFQSLFVVSDLYKTMEAAAYTLALKPDAALEARMDSMIRVIASAQRPDGYMYEAHVCGVPLVEEMGEHPYDRLDLSHELYNMGHLYEAAIAYYRATGKDSLLKIAEKHARHVYHVFFEGDPAYNGGRPIGRVAGHPEIELALCKLFGQTGDSLYLETATRFLDMRGREDGRPEEQYGHGRAQAQEHQLLKDQRLPAGHAVCAAYVYSGMSDADRICGTQIYREALDSIWKNIASTRIALTGGLGAVRGIEGFGPEYDLPNKEAYNETCASVANVFFQQRMFLSTPEARYFDLLECALYNGALSGINLHGDRFFYVNPLEADGLKPFNLGARGRVPWFGCACCPPNIARLIAQVGGYLYAHTEADIYCTLYAGSDTEIPLKEGVVTVSQTTNYPFEGETSLVLTPEKPMHFGLRLRIPTWAQGREFIPGGLYTYAGDMREQKWEIMVNGQPVEASLEEGFAVIHRRWKPGDRVTLSLPLAARYVQARPEVEADRDRLAVVRGPLVYCAEEPDNGLVQRYYLPQPGSFRVEAFSEGLLSGIPALETQAARLDNGEANLRLIPYYAWDNRGDGSMVVWLPRTEALSRESLPVTEKNKVWLKEMHLGCNDTKVEQEAIFDGMMPFKSHHQGYPGWTSRGCEGEAQQLEFLFTGPRVLESFSVFWISDARTTTLLPRTWTLDVLVGGQWRPLKLYVTDLYGLDLDRFNEVRPGETVSCEGLRLNLTPQPGKSVGLSELRIELKNP